MRPNSGDFDRGGQESVGQMLDKGGQTSEFRQVLAKRGPSSSEAGPKFGLKLRRALRFAPLHIADPASQRPSRRLRDGTGVASPAASSALAAAAPPWESGAASSNDVGVSSTGHPKESGSISRTGAVNERPGMEAGWILVLNRIAMPVSMPVYAYGYVYFHVYVCLYL